MKKTFFLFIICVMVANPTIAQNAVEIPLWPGGAPESNGITKAEITENNYFVLNITEAKMYVYHPTKENNTGAAVVICPGGGYSGEAIFHEGHDFARWLIEKGITAIVLKYRLPNQHHFIPLKDAHQALRTVRHNAKEWGVDPNKIGISGFSAGGHLAATAGTRFDAGNASASDPRVSCRPDFMLLFYPVITLKEAFTHFGTRNNLIGPAYNAELVALYSNEEQVTEQTPPAFLILSDDDEAVAPRNSIEFYTALKKYQIPASLHIIPSGGHGWGTNASNKQFKEWSVPLENWLAATILKK
jgi:acetyl esterase/lipase